jgi:hypothetical protein
MASLSNYSAHLKESALKPGAGAYSPDKDRVLARNAGYSLGREKQRVNSDFDRMIKSQADPGQYNPQRHESAAAYGFGTSKRTNHVPKTLLDNPGAQYNLPPIR